MINKNAISLLMIFNKTARCTPFYFIKFWQIFHKKYERLTPCKFFLFVLILRVRSFSSPRSTPVRGVFFTRTNVGNYLHTLVLEKKTPHTGVDPGKLNERTLNKNASLTPLWCNEVTSDKKVLFLWVQNNQRRNVFFDSQT